MFGWHAFNMGAAKRANVYGPTGERLAENVSQLRGKDGRGLSTYEMSRRLGEIGRPIQPTGILKIESNDRRVDADDLMALALVLDVTPNRLLLPPTADADQVVELTPTEHTTAGWAWRWAADGELPLGNWPPVHGDSTIVSGESGARGAYKRRQRFRTENNPHIAPEPSLQDVAPHLEAIERATQAMAEAARSSGIPLEHLVQMVKWRAADRLQSDTED